MERLRVTVTRVYEYTPDLTEDFYAELGIATMEAAAKVDLDELRTDKVSITEIADEVSVTFNMEIFDDGIG